MVGDGTYLQKRACPCGSSVQAIRYKLNRIGLTQHTPYISHNTHSLSGSHSHTVSITQHKPPLSLTFTHRIYHTTHSECLSHSHTVYITQHTPNVSHIHTPYLSHNTHRLSHTFPNRIYHTTPTASLSHSHTVSITQHPQPLSLIHTPYLSHNTHRTSHTKHTHRFSYTLTHRVSHTKHTQILLTEHALSFSITYSEILSNSHTHTVSLTQDTH
jgi:hypothetical protein